ncbi:efflux RND transporter permease subunit [Sinimarinibacterium flocculans]|uniref:Multidrug efflux pump subunit AcrB n=1 Tax=Sinimarinibacterium flocculans TaxID=985250 RepID=A0A318EEJ8_9GAMM|nr:efflux RND transporter permease subunit [Sinimarinibacterium flocculans]PXV71233.1 multidrug efflux pump subunit AcrB [Sinimarinibacterium flocculans]
MVENVLQRGTLLAVATLVVCVLGLAAVLRVPVQMIPDLDVRTISVQTRWPGATPQDVEKEILIEQETYLRAIPGLQRLVSYASTGAADVELEFPFGIDITQALLDVNNALSQVPAYPENVDEPRVTASSFSQNSFMYFRVTPLPGNPLGLDMNLMRDFVDDNVRVRMERVPGVSQVRIGGGAERQVQIEVDPGALAERGLTLPGLRDTIRARNRDASGGDLDAGKRRYLVRTVGRFETLADIENLVVAARNGTLIRLRDVATVRLDHFELRERAMVDGENAISLAVNRLDGSNVISIKRGMLPVIDEINETVLGPAGMTMALISDDVRYVEESVSNVFRNLAIGATLAIGVMFLFLRSAAATGVGAIGIPICTIAAFLGLLLAGRTINVISMAGVAFAIGMTLDNTIVVLEAIERERSRGASRLAAAAAAVRRVWPAVLASTLTTVIVFMPVLFIEQEAGQLYSDVAIAISASILASMLVAITLIPAASLRMGFAGDGNGVGATQAPRGFRKLTLSIAGWLVATPSRRWGYLAAIVAVTAAALIALTPPAEYLPEGEEPKTFASMIAPPGYNLTEMTAIAQALQDELLPHVEADRDAYARGETDVPPLAYLNMRVAPQNLRIIAETVDPADIDALMRALTRRYQTYPGMRAFAARGSIISSNDGGTRSVNVDISGADLAEILTAAQAVYARAREVLGDPQIGSDPPSLSLGQPLIEIRPDWARVAETGLDASALGFTVAALSDGAFVDEFFVDDSKVDIYLFSDAGFAQTLANLPDLPLHTPTGVVVPLSAVAELVETVDTDELRRVNGRRTVTLNVIPPRSIALETAVGRVQTEVVDALIAEGAIPQGVLMDISGASDQLDATREALAGNFLIALLLCYFLLVAIFTHWGYPLVIMTTVPLGIAGGIVGLALLNLAIRQPFDMITMLGFLIVLGTVVNNPILIVDQARHNLRAGAASVEQAVLDALDSRLRPILMTTVTTVFGLGPLVLIPGAGTELYRGLGVIVLSGLVFATLLTLSFLPVLLTTLLRLRGPQPAGAPA